MKKALAFFTATIKKNRMSHLYLINGPKGAGKLNLAFLVSLELLKRKGDDEERLLQQIKTQTHPNVILIKPEGTVIKKEQILLLQNEFSKTSLVGGARIYIISEVEKISTSAANSLLKFLEEPEGESTYGFLLTENLNAVIETIKSRSQIMTLSGIDKKQIKAQLEAHGTDQFKAELLSEITKDPDEAFNLIEHPAVIELEAFLKKLSELYDRPEAILQIDLNDYATSIRQDRQWFMILTNLLLVFFADVVRYKVHRELTFESLREEIRKISVKTSMSDAELITDKIKDLIKKQNTYINLELAFFELLNEIDKRRNNESSFGSV